MNQYNPYAAPAAPAGFGPVVPVHGAPQPWSVGEVIKGGWEIYKGHWAPLTFGYFVASIVGAVPGQIAPALKAGGLIEQGSGVYYAVHAPLSVVGWLIGTFFAAGFTRAALRAVRTNDPTFGDFFTGGGRFIPFLVTSFLSSLAIGFGLLLLIVPGIVLALGFVNAPYYVIDQKLGPIEALKASWASTMGQKGDLFVLALAEAGLSILGVLACCLGIVVAVPVIMVANAIVYTRLSGTAALPVAPPGAYGAGGYGAPGPATGAPGAYGQWGPPGGGYGGGGPPGGGYGGPPGGGYGGGGHP